MEEEEEEEEDEEDEDDKTEEDDENKEEEEEDEEEDEEGCNESKLKSHGSQGISRPVLVGLMNKQRTVIEGVDGFTAVICPIV